MIAHAARHAVYEPLGRSQKPQTCSLRLRLFLWPDTKSRGVQELTMSIRREDSSALPPQDATLRTARDRFLAPDS